MSCTYCSRNDKGNFHAIKNELNASDAPGRQAARKTQSPAVCERDKTAKSFPKTNFNILHCTTAPKEVTHAEIFFSSKQKTFLDHCCCNLFSAFESMQLMEFWRLRSRVLFAQAALFANSKHGWLSISHHCYTPRRAKMFGKKRKRWNRVQKCF